MKKRELLTPAATGEDGVDVKVNAEYFRRVNLILSIVSKCDKAFPCLTAGSDDLGKITLLSEQAKQKWRVVV